MLRIAICDNDIHALESLTHAVRSFMQARGSSDAFLRRFQSGYDLVECLESPHQHFHIYLLNIEMPIYSGIEVGRMVRQLDAAATVIYMADSPEHAIHAQSAECLFKPIDAESLHQALENACCNAAQDAHKTVVVRGKQGPVQIALREIEYVEYRNHALAFHTTDGRTFPSCVLRTSFTDIAAASFSDARFIRPHEAYIVNMDAVGGINDREFVLRSGASVPISRRVYREVRRQYAAHMAGHT